MIPTQVRLNIYKGQTFDDVLIFENSDESPLDLTGRVCRMQARASVDDPVVLLELGTADGTIVVDDMGNLAFHVTAAATAALNPDNFDVAGWVYDLEWVLPVSGVVERPIEGILLVFPEVTR